MGTPKPLLRYEGQTLIARQVANASRQVWLAADGERYADTDGASYLPDALPHKQGALCAILPALLLAKKSGFSGLYIMSCDTLMLPETMISLLNQAKDTRIWQQGISALQEGKQLLPLLAHWSVQVADSLNAAVNSGNQRVQHFVWQQAHQTIDLPTHYAKLSHFNTPEEFEAALRAAKHFQAAPIKSNEK